MLELSLLGPVRAVRAGRELPLGGPRQRAVLALLVVEAGQVVPAGRLIDQLWRGGPPPGAATTLRSYVSRLRTLLAPDATLVARGGGYVLALGQARVDAGEFEGLAGAGRAALAAGEAAAAANRFREALELWRGQALADVIDVEALALEAARLEEMRLVAVEGRIEADLALGRQAEVAGELETLVAEYPVRERLWRLLVLALYRAERQADALAACRRARAMLAEELGLDPGEELRLLEEQVLRHEVPAVPAPVRPGNLPTPLTGLVGRDRDLAEVGRLMAGARLVTLTGPGGSGKTRLALEAAARAARRFPDGAWLAGLAGIASAQLVASRVMETLGIRQAGDLPVIEALLYRLHAAELLLVLDNCEHLLDACTGLAETLLAGSPGLRILATSREALGVPGEAAYLVPPLEVPPESASAQAIAQAPAVLLFVDRASAARAGAASDAPVETVARICRGLDGLPLAIELAAARMSTLSATEIEAYLAGKFGFLRHRRPVSDRRHQTLKAAIDWSYDLLGEDERRVFAELSVFVGGFGLAQAAEVCSSGNQVTTLEVIDQLAAKSLLTAQTTPGGTRYQMLETIRDYAASRLAETGEDGPTRRRHAEAFLRLAEREDQLAVLARDHDNFHAALEWSLSTGDEGGPRLAHELGDFWLARGLLHEGSQWLERALAQRAADPRVRAGLLRLLGTVLYDSGGPQRAKAVLTEGSQVAAAADLPAAAARIRLRLVEIQSTEGMADALALKECEAATNILETEGDLAGLAEAWILAGQLKSWVGDVAACQQALARGAEYARESGNRYAEAQANLWLAISFAEDLPVPADVAIGRVEQLLDAARGEPSAEANSLMWLAMLYGYVGRFTDARRAAARSKQMLTEMGVKLQSALCAALVAGQIELIAGDPAAAEHHTRDGYEMLRAMGEHGYRSTVTGMLAETVYAQGRLAEAERLAAEARALAAPDDLDVRCRWRAAQAKIHARRGEFDAARRLVTEAEALIAPTSWAVHKAEVLTHKAEVCELAGAPAEAAASLHQALRIYEDKRAVALADRVRAALTSLAARSGTGTA
jgi:predicted ATPase/DNA-binding SARP family transcriptional activator